MGLVLSAFFIRALLFGSMFDELLNSGIDTERQ